MRHLKKAAARLPFLWAQRYAFVLPGQKKARGPGRLRADGKIPSRGQFEGTGSVQVTIKAHRIPDIRYRLQRPRAKTVFLVFRSSGILRWIGKSGYCKKRYKKGFLHHAPLGLHSILAGAPHPEQRVCQCIVGETPRHGSNKMYRFARS
jgi:hypothetical protein